MENGCKPVATPFAVPGVVATERLWRAAGVRLPERSFCQIIEIRPVTSFSPSVSVPVPEICETGLDDPDDSEGRAELGLESDDEDWLCRT